MSDTGQPPWAVQDRHLTVTVTVTSHQSPVTSHQSPVTSHQSPVTSHRHQSPDSRSSTNFSTIAVPPGHGPIKRSRGGTGEAQ